LIRAAGRCRQHQPETEAFSGGEKVTPNARGQSPYAGRAFGLGWRRDKKSKKKENRMRMVMVALIAMTASSAMADDTEGAHRQAISGRDSYWNCLAQEYSRESNKGMSDQDFTRHIASVCPSERQNFRVTLVDYLAMQFPGTDAGDHMTTANNAIASAQKDVVTAFIKHRTTAPK
jgi:hypothetical protein